MISFPDILAAAISDGVWKTPDLQSLRELLNADLPDVELFADEEMMRHVAKQLESSGYVDDPEFCFARESATSPEKDARLIFEHALFIGGSTVPGDDVFIAVSLNEAGTPEVFVFDWEQAIPDRWVARATLAQFIQGLERLSA